MKKAIWIGMLLLACISVSAQDTKDTLESWMSKFYKLTNPVISDNGKWAAVRKRYNLNQDTLLIINTNRPNIPAATIVVDGPASFLKDHGALVYGKQKAEFVNLRSGKRQWYENVLVAHPLSELGQYGILTKDSLLSVYAVDGVKLHHIAGVKGIPVSWENKSLYLARKDGDTYEILSISDTGLRKLSTVEYPAKEIELSPSGKHLIIKGNDEGSGNPRLTFIDTKEDRTVSLPDRSPGKEDYYMVSEVQNGKAYFIARYRVQKPEPGLVDIWYGNDDNISAKTTGAISGRYWLWKPQTNQFQELPDDVYPDMAPLNSERYVLAYHPTKGHNFVTYQPQFNDTSIYDVELQTYQPLASLRGVVYGAPEIVCSKNGQFIVGSEDGNKWTLFELRSGKRTVIEHQGLQNPVFSDDSRYILFESENDLWKYDMLNKALIPTRLAAGKALKIVNVEQYDLSFRNQISVRIVDSQKPILLEIKDRNENLTSYGLYNMKGIKEIIQVVRNKVRNVVYDPGLQYIGTLEENYTLSSQLFIKKRKGKKKLIFAAITPGKDTNTLKQEIVHFTTAEGKPLKGVLYYPRHFALNKKYPMVVHIYQIQSDKYNEYWTPGYNNRDGLDVRTLVERGYFVLLPDTAVGPAGPGLSALDCVHKALDAVSKNVNIDMQKVGLVGHSFGGYETNFIATHSNRFAAFISGAGDSNIIETYFSYNYHYPGPHYWQFENSIYNMPPFTENKKLYFKNNPIHSVEKVASPILLWTGKKDQNVPWDRTTEFYIGLKRNKKPVIALFYSNGRHALGFYTKEKKDLYIKVLEWWDYFLKDKKNVPWIDRQMKGDAL